MKILLILILTIIIYLYVIHRKKENFDIFCDKEKDKKEVKKHKLDFFYKKKNINKHLNKINTNNLPKFIYKSDTLIPYNYTDKLDYNLIYNFNIKKKEKIKNLEKNNYGSIMPNNSKILLKNYNFNLNQFFKDRELPKIYKDKCKNVPKYEGTICNLKNFEINLLGRYTNNKLHLNWNLPNNCIDINEFFIFYKLKDNEYSNDYKVIKIDYNNKSEEIIYDIGKIHIYKDFYNIQYNFYFKNKNKYNCFIFLKCLKKEIYSNKF